MNLFPTHLPRISSLVDYDLVTVPNRSNARYAMDDSGRRWVCKRQCDTGSGPLLAEAIATLFGRAIGAPVPEGAVYMRSNERAWLSRYVDGALHWSPSLRDRIYNLDEAGAMLTLDALLLDSSRHASNILVAPSPDETRLRLYAIDAGQAQVGASAFLSAPVDALPQIAHQAKGLPIAALRQGALSAAERATRLDTVLIREFTVESCALVHLPSPERLAAALEARCRQARSLALRYLDALHACP